MNGKKIRGIILILMMLFLSSCANPLEPFESGNQTDKLSVYLWNVNLMDEYAPYIQSQFPDVEIEFVVGNNDLDFYKFLAENESLPDIMTNRRFSLNDADELDGVLLDLSGTEEAASIHMTYLENYQNSDGTVNWLPICGVADNIIANKALFEEYAIPLPTDYDSFVSACQAFETHGIRGFVCDFIYDYTCLEVLQGLSASELTSLEGQQWRLEYEDPTNAMLGLDSTVWPGVFERFERFIQDVHLTPEDADLDFNQVLSMFQEGKAAMIRGTSDMVMNLITMGMEDVVMLPYYSLDGSGWLLTYPSFHVALNKDLEQDEKRKELAFRVLDVMLSEEGQNMLSQQNDTLSYSKNVELKLSDRLANIKPYIESNHLYIRLASEDFFTFSKEVVQKMLQGEYDPKEAYQVFNNQLWAPKDNGSFETVATFGQTIPYEFSCEGGNPAASAIANTLRKYYETDLLISPAYNFTGPILNTGYSEKMIGYMIMPNACNAYVREMSGAEVYALLRATLEGIEGSAAPFNQSSLPILSGASMEIEKGEGGTYTLNHIQVDGQELDAGTSYMVTYLNPVSYYNEMIAQVYPDEGTDAFQLQRSRVRDAWTAYIKEGHSLEAPTNYVVLK